MTGRNLQNMTLCNPFVYPDGLFGQLLIYYAKPTHILGFLDNDTSKQQIRDYSYPSDHVCVQNDILDDFRIRF